MLIRHHVTDTQHVPDKRHSIQWTDKMGEITPVHLPLYHREQDDVDMMPAKLGDIASPGKLSLMDMEINFSDK